MRIARDGGAHVLEELQVFSHPCIRSRLRPLRFERIQLRRHVFGLTRVTHDGSRKHDQLRMSHKRTTWVVRGCDFAHRGLLLGQQPTLALDL